MRPGLKQSNECPVCEGVMETLIELPRFPMTEMYEPWGGVFEDKGYVDQSFLYCSGCSHGKLGTIVPPEVLYTGTYRTASAKSVGSLGAISKFWQFIRKHVPDAQYDCVVDLGANDGSLLSLFRGKRLVAVDPNASGDAELVKQFIEEADLSHLKVLNKLICCSHTLEHVEKPESVFAKLREIVSVNDYCAFQFPSLDYLVKDCRMDQIHHQHIHYYSLRSISMTLAKYGFEIVHHEFDTNHYGTLMIIFRRGLEELRGNKIEANSIIFADEMFRAEASNLDDRIGGCDDLVGYGASLMLPVLKYYVPQLKNLKYVIDEDESKIGQRYTNMNVEIRPFQVLSGNVMVTAFNTKMAVRRIVEKLFTMPVQNVIVPFHVL